MIVMGGKMLDFGVAKRMIAIMVHENATEGILNSPTILDSVAAAMSQTAAGLSGKR